jgi:hypothetical protein
MFNNQIAKPFFCLVIFLVLLSLSCTQDKNGQKVFPIGIWQGVSGGVSGSYEFKENGCLIIISEDEEDIGVAHYVIDFQKQPWHLDIEVIVPRYSQIKTLIEKVDNDTIRMSVSQGDSRPTSFDDKSVLLHRTQDSVLPKSKSLEERNKVLDQSLIMESIWFEGKNHKEMLDICEAMFRYQFTKNASGQQQKAPAYYLSIYETDPPKELMNRFENNNPPVKLGSEFKIGNGLKFRIRSIKLLDKNNIEIEGGYYEGSLSSSGNTYQLKKQSGVWKVISDKMNWIS